MSDQPGRKIVTFGVDAIRYDASVSVPIDGLAANWLRALKQLVQSKTANLATPVCLAFPVFTGLTPFWRVDSEYPDPLAVYLDGVRIDDAGRANDTCITAKRRRCNEGCNSRQ